MGIIVASRGEGGNTASIETVLEKFVAAVESIDGTCYDIREVRRWLVVGVILLL